MQKRKSTIPAAIFAVIVASFYAFREVGKEWDKFVAGGTKALNEQRYDDAVVQYTAALNEARRSGKEDERLAASLVLLSNAYIKAGKYYYAITPLEESIKILEKSSDPNSYLPGRLQDLSTLYSRTGENEKAEKTAKRCLELVSAKDGPKSGKTVTALVSLGSMQFTEGKFSEAEANLQNAYAITKENKEIPADVTAGVLTSLGATANQKADFVSAEKYSKEALAILEKQRRPNPLLVAGFKSNLAATYLEEYKFADAKALAEQGLTDSEKAFGRKHPELIASLEVLAAVCIHMDDTEAGIKHLERAFTIAKATYGAGSPNLLDLYERLANAYQIFHSNKAALSAITDGMAIGRNLNGESQTDVSRLLQTNGNVCDSEGNLKESEDSLTESVELMEKVRSANAREMISPLVDLGRCYVKEHRLDDAQKTLLRAESISKRYEQDLLSYRCTQKGMAELRASQGRLSEADSLCARVLELDAKTMVPTSSKIAQDCEDYAKLLDKEHKAGDAAKLRQRAKEIRDSKAHT